MINRGPQTRPLLKTDILIAQQNTQSALAAARYLSVSYVTYKKYAKLYGIFKTQERPSRGRYNAERRTQLREAWLKELLDGKRPYANRHWVKGQLFKYGFLHEECELCGYHEQRLTDHKVPLYLHFKDSNKKNFKFENLQVLCLNCTFLTVGNLTRSVSDYNYAKD